MPFFRFFCGSCNTERNSLINTLEAAKDPKNSPSCRKCGKPMTLGMGTSQSNEYTVADEERGKKHLVGVSDMLKERSEENYRKHELARIIAEHGEQYAKDNNLIDEDGRSKV